MLKDKPYTKTLILAVAAGMGTGALVAVNHPLGPASAGFLAFIAMIAGAGARWGP